MNERFEKRKVKQLLDATRGAWSVEQHEDRRKPNIPDLSFAVNGVDGWVEAKAARQEPANIKSLFPVNKLTAGQVSWMEDRAEYGNGRCFLYVAIGEGSIYETEHFLFRIFNPAVREIRDRRISYKDAKLMADWWAREFHVAEFLAALVR